MQQECGSMRHSSAAGIKASLKCFMLLEWGLSIAMQHQHLVRHVISSFSRPSSDRQREMYCLLRHARRFVYGAFALICALLILHLESTNGLLVCCMGDAVKRHGLEEG